RRVELRYDPEDLTAIDVFPGGRPAGTATPFITRRHVHRAVPQAVRPEPVPTGIDYPGLVAAAHEEAKIDFAQLAMLTSGDLLAAETAERHRRVVLIVDEAHLLDPAQLEELRLLTNAEMDSASPFAG